VSEQPLTITSASGHGLQPGDVVMLKPFPLPWYIRLWHWIIRKKPKQYRITSVSGTVMTVKK
jgi:hypothetical protein